VAVFTMTAIRLFMFFSRLIAFALLHTKATSKTSSAFLAES